MVHLIHLRNYMPRKKKFNLAAMREHILKTMDPMEEYDPNKHDCDAVLYEDLRRVKIAYDMAKSVEAGYDTRQTLHERVRVLSIFANRRGQRYKRRVHFNVGDKGYTYYGFMWMTRAGYLLVDLSPAYEDVQVFVRTDGSMCGVNWKHARKDETPKTYPNINWWFPKDQPPNPWIHLSPPIRSYT